MPEMRRRTCSPHVFTWNAPMRSPYNGMEALDRLANGPHRCCLCRFRAQPAVTRARPGGLPELAGHKSAAPTHRPHGMLAGGGKHTMIKEEIP